MDMYYFVLILVILFGFAIEENKVNAFEEDVKFGPRIFRNGKVWKPDSNMEIMLMPENGNMQNFIVNFTGYFVGFAFYARKEALLNLQIFQVRRLTDEANLVGYYELLAQTGFFKTKKGKQKVFLGQSFTLVGGNVILAAMYKKKGNPIAYNKVEDCSENTVLYSGAVSSLNVFDEVNFVERRCHTYSLRGILLPTNYAEKGCDMHVASKYSITFISSHLDFSIAPYPNDYTKCWIIRAESAKRKLEIESVMFQTEEKVNSSCIYDTTRIYSLKLGSDMTQMVSTCGFRKLERMSVDAGQYIYMNLTTDHSYAFYGFYLGATSVGVHSAFPVGVAVASCIAFVFFISSLVIIYLVIIRQGRYMPLKETASTESTRGIYLDEDKRTQQDPNKLMFSRALAFNRNLYGRGPTTATHNSDFYYDDVSRFKGRSNFRSENENNAPLIPFTTIDGTSYTPTAIVNPGYEYGAFMNGVGNTPRAQYGRLLWRSAPSEMYSTAATNEPISNDYVIMKKELWQPQYMGYYSRMLGQGQDPALLFSTVRTNTSVITPFSTRQYNDYAPGGIDRCYYSPR